MADSKLRLSIVTQLDNAGIKATKEQIDKLEDSMKKMGGGGEESASKLENALGKLPGPLGKIGKACGGIAGQVTSVIGAFMMGVEIGNQICDKILKPLGLMKDGVEELKKENRAYAHEMEALKSATEAATEAEQKRIEKAQQQSEKALKRIDDETNAYFRQAEALQGLKDSQGDAEMLNLERNKFEDMRAYQLAGYSEAADQLGKYYDVVAEEMKQKKAIEDFDRESLKLTEQRLAKEEAYAKASERAVQAKEKLDRLESNLEKWKSKHTVGGLGEWVTTEAEEIEWNAMEKQVESARKAYEKSNATMMKRGEALETIDAQEMKRQLDRAILSERTNLEIDKAAQAYDDYSIQHGNPLNADIDANWSAELLKNSIDSYQALLDTRDNTAAFAEKLEELLGMKQ